MLLYCLRCAPRGTRGTRSAPVPQLRCAWRLPPRRLSSSRSSSFPPRLGLRVQATQSNSAAASRAARARSIPWPSVLTRIPTLRGGTLSRFPSVPASLGPASDRCQPGLSTALSALPPPVASPGAGAALPMRLGGCAVPAQSLYREEEEGSGAGRGRSAPRLQLAWPPARAQAAGTQRKRILGCSKEAGELAFRQRPDFEKLCDSRLRFTDLGSPGP